MGLEAQAAEPLSKICYIEEREKRRDTSRYERGASYSIPQDLFPCETCESIEH